MSMLTGHYPTRSMQIVMFHVRFHGHLRSVCPGLSIFAEDGQKMDKLPQRWTNPDKPILNDRETLRETLRFALAGLDNGL